MSVKLGDLGSSTCFRGQKLSQIFGSLTYLAPELIHRESLYYEGPPVDVFAMGICLFVLLTGQNLFPAPVTSEGYDAMSPLNSSYYNRFIEDPHNEILNRKLKLS
jgi:serine/threonine protein kinase